MVIMIPGVRVLRSKLSSAVLLGNVVKNSLQFKIRRTALKRYKKNSFETIIVDMDGTLYESDASLETLKIFYDSRSGTGALEGEEIYDSMVGKIASGQWSIEQAIFEGNKFLMQKGVGKKDFAKVITAIENGMRKSLLRALKRMKKKGKTLVLATMSSKEFGELLNKKILEKYGFSFDYIVGTELDFDEAGKICGIKKILSSKDTSIEGIPVKSKLTSVREVLSENGKTLNLNSAVIITDSYGDIDISKIMVTILIKPKHPTKAQKVSHSLRLADYLIPDDLDLQRNLESIILGPGK